MKREKVAICGEITRIRTLNVKYVSSPSRPLLRYVVDEV